MNGDGRIPECQYVHLVIGMKSAMPADRAVFDFHVQTLGRLLSDADWCAAGIGRHQVETNEWVIAAGGRTRTGLEDDIRLDRDRRAPSNAALVARGASVRTM